MTNEMPNIDTLYTKREDISILYYFSSILPIVLTQTITYIK